jgi:cytochrome b561
MENLVYTPVARWMHWISAVLVVGLTAVGLYLGQFDPPDGRLTDWLYNLHESFGVILWVLVLIRLVARQIYGVPAIPAGSSRLVRLGAGLNHAALYAAMLIQPITGFIGNNAGGYRLTMFNLLAIPDPVGKDPKLADTLFALHSYGGWALVALVTLHLLGAAYHGVRRDGVVSRMV